MKRLLILVSILVFTSISSQAQWQATYCQAGYIKCLLANDSNLFAGTESGVFLSANNDTNASWTPLNTGLPDYYIQAMANIGTYLFAGIWGPSGGIYLSTNNGTSWLSASSGLPVGPYFFVNNFAVMRHTLFAGTEYGIYLSSDSGKTWKSVNNGLPAGGTQALAVIDTALYAGTTNGVYVSSNSGATWMLSGLDSISVNALLFSGSNLFAGTNTNGVYFSPDSGAAWAAVNNGLPLSFPIFALASTGNKLFAGTDGAGIFLSSNNGTGWLPVNQGLSGTALNINALAMSGNNLFAGTLGSGLFVAAPDTLTGISEGHKNSPQLSIYPNPSDGLFFIKSNTTGKQLLELFDISGGLIQSQQLNSNSTTLDARNLLQGIYDLRVSGDNGIENKKLILVR
jgi:ligand-binding sensor domain-containing protein